MMKGFSATEAALEGFRITRENPRAVAIWAFASFVFSVLAMVADAMMPANVREAVNALNADQPLTLGQLANTMILAAPVLVFGLAMLSITAAAVYRLIFRHDDARFGYLRVGADEFRLMGLAVLGFILTVGLVFGVSVVAGIVLAIISAVAPGVAQTLAWPAAVFSLLVVFGILVRLSLAPIATFAERRITIFESWTLTRGYFWPLLGAYTLAVSCIVVIGLLILILFTSVAGAIIVSQGGDLTDLSSMIRPGQGTLRSFLSVGLIAYMIVSSIFSALWYAVIAAPGAVAYRELHGTPANIRPVPLPEGG